MAAPSSSFGDCSSKGKFQKEDIESECRGGFISNKLYFDVPASMVHLESYLDSLKSSLNVASIVEVGGTILSAKLAKERGWAINIDGRVYILDMYNPDIYLFDYVARRYINQKVEVMIKKHIDGTATNEYLTKLDQPLKISTGLFDPELIIYNAGTDILDGDPMGRLKISPDGIPMRDERVFRFAREKNIPMVMLKSDIGGYMKSSAKVITDSIINLSKKSR